MQRRHARLAVPRVACLLMLLAQAPGTGAQSAQEPDDMSRRIRALEDRVERLEKMVEGLEGEGASRERDAEPGESPSDLATPGADTEPAPGSDSPPRADHRISIVSWSYRYVKGKFQDGYEITYQLHNGYSKGIKLLDGAIEFTDLLGDRIYGIKLAKYLRIDAGGMVEKTGTYGMSKFNLTGPRMKKINPEDIRARLSIRAIVFDDNTYIRF